MFGIEGVQRSIGELRRYIYREKRSLEDLVISGDGQSEKPYQQGQYFGEKHGYYTISGQLTIPEAFQNSAVELEIFSSKSEWDNSTNPQMKLYLNGQLIQGLDVNHQEVVLPDWVYDEQTCDFRLEIYSGREEKQFPIFIKLNVVDQAVKDVFYDLAVALKCCLNFEKGTRSYLAIYPVLEEAVRLLDYRTPFSEYFYKGLEACRQYLQTHLYQKYEELPGLPKVVAVGHTHIDVAWLWTVEQAIEKSQRSFSTVLKLMEEYPEYQFLQSQPQLYDFVKERYPDMYASIKERIAEGRWEAEGSMWVEADCNLTSGESLVRQILYGKRFFKQEFGKDNKILWLPDVFGYSAALPQILKKTGTPYFMTTKLSWNQFNKIPYDTFYWRGIDGSEVLTHFITTTNDGYKPSEHFTTYNGLLEPKAVLGSWKRYGEKEINDEILIAYGYGDGGGGPNHQMLENARRLNSSIPGMPRVRQGKALDYFESLESRLAGQKVPKWMGELYFEYHRGTYTSMARNKRDNRKGEFLLQSIEKVYAQLSPDLYPASQLERLWKLLLLNQFHDILPGTSIQEVYDVTAKEYEELFQEGNQLLQDGLRLLGNSDGGAIESVLVFNPLGFERASLVELELEDGYGIPDSVMQKTAKGKLLVEVKDVPSLGYRCLPIGKVETPTREVSEGLSSEVQTPYYQIQFNEAFEMVSLFDKSAQRELLPDGKVGNRLVAYEDMSMAYDAWDIDIYYKKKPYVVEQLVSAKLIESGPIRQTIEIVREFEKSKITQHLHLYEQNPRIDFETWVDWKEEHTLLKVEFPVDVNTLSATFDIQFGNVTRPVHQNTSWDVARFEVCGQKWIDMSDGGYGLSIMTDSKYGYDVDYQKMGISLLRSPIDPYADADKELHHFTYAIYPHSGTWQEAKTVSLAYDLNVPFVVENVKSGMVCSEAWLSCDQENIMIDTVKKAEDSEAIIVRMFENHNKSTTAALNFAKSPKAIYLCDMMEQEIEQLTGCTVDFRPYEVQTLKIKF